MIQVETCIFLPNSHKTDIAIQHSCYNLWFLLEYCMDLQISSNSYIKAFLIIINCQMIIAFRNTEMLLQMQLLSTTILILNISDKFNMQELLSTQQSPHAQEVSHHSHPSSPFYFCLPYPLSLSVYRSLSLSLSSSLMAFYFHSMAWIFFLFLPFLYCFECVLKSKDKQALWKLYKPPVSTA